MGKRFAIRIKGEVVLDESQIWPDGDAPENPTANDALAVLDAELGLSDVLVEWGLEDDFKFDVFDMAPIVTRAKDKES